MYAAIDAEKRAVQGLVSNLNKTLEEILNGSQKIFTSESLPYVVDNIISHYLDQLLNYPDVCLQLFVRNEPTLLYIMSDSKFLDKGRVSPGPYETVVPEKRENVQPLIIEYLLSNPFSFKFLVMED